MSSRPSRWTKWRENRKLNAAIELGVRLSQTGIDTRIDNATQVTNTIDTEPDFSIEMINDTQDLTTDIVDYEQDSVPKIIRTFHTESDKSTDNTSKSKVDVRARDEISAKDIAASLVLLKRKHRLSISCINDIIHLLENLHVQNTPSSWYKVKRLMTKSKAISKEYSICPICNEARPGKANCPTCVADHPVSLQPFHIFSITDQIQQILLNNSNVNLLYQNRSTSMSDIHDGAIFRSIRDVDPNPVITLTMNIDGVQLSKESQSSIWPILLLMNELPAKARFNIENVILAGIWPGPKKPSRDQIRLLCRPFIDELRYLENGHVFDLSGDQKVNVSVYLIAACCDKPAQAIVQCISDPIAPFGCGRCETEGDVTFCITDSNEAGRFEKTFDKIENEI